MLVFFQPKNLHCSVIVLEINTKQKQYTIKVCRKWFEKSLDFDCLKPVSIDEEDEQKEQNKIYHFYLIRAN